jgi:hypothetical protein
MILVKDAIYKGVLLFSSTITLCPFEKRRFSLVIWKDFLYRDYFFVIS